MAKSYTTVNKKLVGLFILLGILGCSEGYTSSFFPTTTLQQQQDTSLSLFANSWLAKQVGNVKCYISSSVSVHSYVRKCLKSKIRLWENGVVV